ncbi:hypothetical protein NDU88_005457 [Pleurodeles waltl]|uniref:Uncharacterized protein n=1 Tax=Pleurodeles waltl TaxID=8319 RepID=A0AAV7SLQ5_PLEWA|nr:hypothetical protein NDU88_005457 [Pleurodeles waltl]
MARAAVTGPPQWCPPRGLEYRGVFEEVGLAWVVAVQRVAVVDQWFWSAEVELNTGCIAVCPGCGAVVDLRRPRSRRRGVDLRKTPSAWFLWVKEVRTGLMWPRGSRICGFG